MVASFRYCHAGVWFLFFILLISTSCSVESSSSWRQRKENPNKENNNLRGGSGRQLVDTSLTGRIIGGSDVSDENRYPYYVSLVSWDWSHVCGGSLIVSDSLMNICFDTFIKTSKLTSNRLFNNHTGT